ncbi:hypothetical protein POSPLADRAFT_1071248 [Postia placenta MAD-698-R-SB12]|uniref:Uncharacterized protein n=1 Tax=Postia placenta MAD-698-R-SB12 TaxID=670580 RepID=A0A1X6MRR9_9APHY|nr:hypothetical protein POSPLADRAFT_1071248 [Postia placenta MAD-698-R-SB12]OSX58926.1 hypothetical protein POSPLADRAFT_1071248 [Postia placenta MAD-698-R-SB12]
MSLNTRLNSTTRATFIGGTLSTFLYGVTCAQVMYYMRRYPMDHTRLWFLVASLWLLDTARTTIWVLVFSPMEGSSLHLYADSDTNGKLSGTSWYFIHCIWRVVEHRKYQLLLTMTMPLFTISTYACTHIDGCSGGRLHRNLIFLHFTWEKDRVPRVLLFATFLGTLHAKPLNLIWLVFYFLGSKLYVNSLLAFIFHNTECMIYDYGCQKSIRGHGISNSEAGSTVEAYGQDIQHNLDG